MTLRNRLNRMERLEQSQPSEANRSLLAVQRQMREVCRLYSWLDRLRLTADEAERQGLQCPLDLRHGVSLASLAELEREPPDEETTRFLLSLPHNLSWEQVLEALALFNRERKERAAP